MDDTLAKPFMKQTNGQENLDKVRQFILDQVAKRGREISLKTLSLAVGKNPAYIHQFIFRGSPRHLPEDVRHKLADHLGISEYALRPYSHAPRSSNALISYIDHPSQHEYLDGPWFVPQSFLERSLCPGSMATAGQDIRLAVVGDCTADFGIAAGDMIMLNTRDRCPLTAGYFALDAGDHIRVRHLEQISPNDRQVMVSGNGPQAYPRLDAQDDILGRVVFHAHLFGRTKAQLPASLHQAGS